MPAILAENGIICENYPDDLPFPGDKPTKAQKSKGVNDLSKIDISRILEAFEDPDYPLAFKRAPADKKSEFILSNSTLTHRPDIYVQVLSSHPKHPPS
jgi:hypothetical protein